MLTHFTVRQWVHHVPPWQNIVFLSIGNWKSRRWAPAQAPMCLSIVKLLWNEICLYILTLYLTQTKICKSHSPSVHMLNYELLSQTDGQYWVTLSIKTQHTNQTKYWYLTMGICESHSWASLCPSIQILEYRVLTHRGVMPCRLT